MMTFVCLYRGDSVNSAKLIGLSSDPDVVSRFAAELLNDPAYAERREDPDPILNALTRGRRHALRLIANDKEGHPK